MSTPRVLTYPEGVHRATPEGSLHRGLRLGCAATHHLRRGAGIQALALGGSGCPSRIRTSANGSKVRCPTTRRRGSGVGLRTRTGSEWSGRWGSNPRPQPWQGCALPAEPLPLDDRPGVGAESQIRTGDTAIFSRVLYQLSYLGPDPGPRGGPSARRRIPRGPKGRQPRRRGSGARREGRQPALGGPPSTASALATGGRPDNSRRRLIRSMAAGCVENNDRDDPVAALIGFSK